MKKKAKRKRKKRKRGRKSKLGGATRDSVNCLPIPSPLALIPAVLWGVWRCPQARRSCFRLGWNGCISGRGVQLTSVSLHPAPATSRQGPKFNAEGVGQALEDCDQSQGHGPEGQACLLPPVLVLSQLFLRALLLFWLRPMPPSTCGHHLSACPPRHPPVHPRAP